ncbi:MAG: hypothetical protein ACKOC8_11520 [Pirellulales bacterium]
MMRITTRLLPAARLAVLAVIAVGCAHHKTNQYAYAPPLAPPVYPQPQTAAQPVAYPAAVPTAGMPAVAGAPVMAQGAPVAMPAVAPVAGDPCCPPLDGAAAGMPVVYESDQTPPCPPGP